MTPIRILLPVTLLAMVQPAQSQTGEGTRCAAAMEATGYAACAEAPRGIALASDKERAHALATFAQSGEERFTFTFGIDPTPYAIVEMRDPTGLSSDVTKLKSLGYTSILPWASREQFKSTLETALRQAARAEARAKGLSADAEAELFRTMLEAEAPRLSRFKMDESDAGTVPHELGHLWFSAAFWLGSPPAEGRYYGTPAPDWLDEMSAILMEGQELADGRRRSFVDVYHGRAKGAFADLPVSELIDLRLFFTRTHPAFNSNKEEMEEVRKSGKTVFMMKVGADAAAVARVAGLFYATGRLVADYMMDRAGGPEVFRSIALSTAQGVSFDAWLQNEGPRYRLPPNLEALDADWRGWLEARFGSPGSAPNLASTSRAPNPG